MEKPKLEGHRNKPELVPLQLQQWNPRELKRAHPHVRWHRGVLRLNSALTMQ